MARDTSLRAQVAEQLSMRSVAGGPLHREALECTDRRYASDVSRAVFHKTVIDDYLARATPRRDGHSAIITAGAPGAGKSFMLRAQVADLADYRIIDADEIKDDLIKQALADGLYDDLLAEILADGYALAPRELAGLVHVESTKLADQIRRICISRKENVAVEGTLTWDGQGPRIFRELADAEYTDIEVYGVDVVAADAHEQALDRWWQRRVAWTNGTDQLGGRFTPAEAIDVCFSTGGQSLCTTHALQFIDTAQSGEVPYVHVSILRKQTTGALEVADERFYRQ